MELEEIRKSLPDGKWFHNSTFEQVDVAAELGHLPSEFWGLDDRDKAFLIARARVKGTMTAWENHLHEQEMTKRNASTGKRYGPKDGRLTGAI